MPEDRARWPAIALFLISLHSFFLPSARAAAAPVHVTSLDGNWSLAIDPKNVGREQHWSDGPTSAAKTARVPWIIQDDFPAYHGVAWYWREFDAPLNPYPGGRTLLRFWAVDYLGDVWLNGVHVGSHEGGETPFVIDVTDKIHPGAPNHISVRVLNPDNTPIDGIVLNQTAHQARVVPYSAGSAYDHGGITGSVEVIVAPPVRIEDLYAQPDPATGVIHVRANLRNSSKGAARVHLHISVSGAAGGEGLTGSSADVETQPGDTPYETDIKIDSPHLWDLNDPYLYHVGAVLRPESSNDDDERTVRCGFRDFRVEKGYFQLNGRRIFLRSTHTCNHFPVGLKLPPDPDMARRDLIDLKAMGFNMVRFIWGGAERYQLDLCDEIGLMVYEEHFGSNTIEDSPKMAERFDRSVSELLQRDRNHPSIVIFGLLNEAVNNPAFHHAITMLPLVRALNPATLIFLNAGRFDGLTGNGGGPFAEVKIWHGPAAREPWIVHNPRDFQIETPFGFKWLPGGVALHPGEHGEYSVARWTCPAAGSYQLKAVFTGLPISPATTDVHVLQNGKPLFSSWLNLHEKPNEQSFSGTLTAAEKDTIDLVVGYGNGSYGSDSTSLSASISGNAAAYDLARDFSTEKDSRGPWSYGSLKSADEPDSATFTRYTENGDATFGSICNPGAAEWQDLLSDQHIYPRVPHTADTIQMLRHVGGGSAPVFLSEYGIGSAVDLWRTTRHFEELGKTDVEDARFYRDRLDHYLADYKAWKLDEIYARPEDFFIESQRKMAGQRSLGLNAIRSNPNIIGYSLTGMNDHVSCGEGLTTTFRELKPGTVDAMFEGWSPLKWCLFAEPANIYRGANVKIEAVLANEDVLRPGDYPARIQVVGPDNVTLLDRIVNVTVKATKDGREPTMVIPVFSAEIPATGPAGKYRLLAGLQQGGAPTGGETFFYVDDPAAMPAVKSEVVLCGQDPLLSQWLDAHQIKSRLFSPDQQSKREVILVGAAPAGSVPFAELARHMARGSTVVFLDPHVFAKGNDAAANLPLIHKGVFTDIVGWLYLKDEWSKKHLIFEGLPTGGLMDYTFYREIVPDLVFTGQDPPAAAIAGAIKASQDYSSGLMVAQYPFGAGRFILNTLRIRESLGTHPAAERLLRNMLSFAAQSADQPIVDLPENFDTQLKAVGYGGRG